MLSVLCGFMVLLFRLWGFRVISRVGIVRLFGSFAGSIEGLRLKFGSNELGP